MHACSLWVDSINNVLASNQCQIKVEIFIPSYETYRIKESNNFCEDIDWRGEKNLPKVEISITK
jgi:hypothetical protein